MREELNSIMRGEESTRNKHWIIETHKWAMLQDGLLRLIEYITKTWEILLLLLHPTNRSWSQADAKTQLLLPSTPTSQEKETTLAKTSIYTMRTIKIKVMIIEKRIPRKDSTTLRAEERNSSSSRRTWWAKAGQIKECKKWISPDKWGNNRGLFRIRQSTNLETLMKSRRTAWTRVTAKLNLLIRELKA